jgi:hypothetical protein
LAVRGCKERGQKRYFVKNNKCEFFNAGFGMLRRRERGETRNFDAIFGGDGGCRADAEREDPFLRGFEKQVWSCIESLLVIEGGGDSKT